MTTKKFTKLALDTFMVTSITAIGFGLSAGDNTAFAVAIVCQWFLIVAGVAFYSKWTVQFELLAWAAMVYAHLYAPEYFIYPYVVQWILILLFW